MPRLAVGDAPPVRSAVAGMHPTFSTARGFIFTKKSPWKWSEVPGTTNEAAGYTTI